MTKGRCRDIAIAQYQIFVAQNLRAARRGRGQHDAPLIQLRQQVMQDLERGNDMSEAKKVNVPVSGSVW